MPACHAGGRGFDSRPFRHLFRRTTLEVVFSFLALQNGQSPPQLICPFKPTDQIKTSEAIEATFKVVFLFLALQNCQTPPQLTRPFKPTEQIKTFEAIEATFKVVFLFLVPAQNASYRQNRTAQIHIAQIRGSALMSFTTISHLWLQHNEECH